MKFRLPPLAFPRRFSRAKRKALRRVIRAAQIRAEYWRRLMEQLPKTLDALWVDAMTAPLSWEACGFVPGAGPFVDDAVTP